jgi:nickel-dependent lactate racemase
MCGADVVQRYPIIDHCATDTAALRGAARTTSGTEVYMHRRYLDADVKIRPSEIKPHCMAGFFGGRKAICPGLAKLATLQKFQSPQWMGMIRDGAHAIPVLLGGKTAV